jgi:hypothetical protein
MTGKQDWRDRHAERAITRLALTREEIEAQRAAVEITEEVNGYTLRGNPEAKTTLPAGYVPTVFEEDAAMWERINAELKGASDGQDRP